ncbi:MAG TPA: TetR/AcrR family transcriptional regulator [Solirubrobacteraceae bacterium]|jgi:AcrR family transcriptional regulator
MEDGVSPQKQRIMREAAKLFASKGYDATGISDILEAVGLGKGALYHHIGSKEALLYDISRAHVVQMVAVGEEILARDEPADVKLRELSRQLIRTIATSLPEVTVFFAEHRAVTGDRRKELMQLRHRFEEIWAAILKQGEHEGIFRPTDEIDVKGVLGTFNYTYVWFKPRGSVSPEQLADRYVELLLGGLKPD